MNQFPSTSDVEPASQSLVQRLWSLLIAPASQLAAVERLQAKLLTALTIAIMLLVIGAFGAATLAGGNHPWATSNGTIALVLGGIPLLFVYVLSRTRHYKLAAWGLILVTGLLFLAIAWPDQSPNDIHLLVYMVVPLLLSSIFLPFRGTVLLGIGILIALLGYQVWVPEARLSWAWDSPLNFVLVVVVLILVIVYHRDQLELVRQTKITESEKRYRRILHTTFTGVVVHQDSVIDEVTIGLARLLGYAPHEMVGMPLQNILNTDESAYTKVGKRLDVEVIHNPHLDEYGNTAMVTAVRDVTEWKQRQRLLEAMSELSQAITVKLDARFILDIFAESLLKVLDVTSVYIYQWNVQAQRRTLLARHCASTANAYEHKVDGLQEEPIAIAPSAQGTVYQCSQRQSSLHQHDKLMAAHDIQTIYQVPFVLNENDSGYVELWESRRHRDYSDVEQQSVQQMISHVTAALRNAYLMRTLQEREAQYRAMLAALPDLVFRQNRQGVYLEVHGDQKDMLVPPSEVIGRSMYDVLPPDWLQQVELAFENVLETGELQVIEYAGVPPGYYEARLVRCGTDEVLALVRNITERKIAEAERTASEERFRQLAENIREVFWMSTHDPRELIYVSPNAAEILGIEADQLLENPVLLTEHVYQEDQASFSQALQSVREGHAAETEFRFIRPSGSQITWLWSRGSPIKDEAGQVYRIVGVLEDITSRKQAENQRLQLAVEQEKVRVLEQFIQDASHDLKTPLAVITTNLFLIKNAKTPADVPRRLQIIELHVGMLERIIDDLLTMSRLDSRESLELRPIDLNGVLRLIQEGLHSLAHERELELTLSLDPLIPLIIGDEAALHRALMNVIENALLYTPPHGRIVVETHVEPTEIAIVVSDTGIGISEDDLPRIFDRFFRANVARTHSGTGLGLSIVERAIKAHGGRIDVCSQLNEGTTFTIYLKRTNDL